MSPTPSAAPITDAERIIRPTGGFDARYPIALLPVRIETRFVGTQQLQVRIFPDEIFADTHEPGLTSAEASDGAAYAATIKTADESAQWSSLVQRYGAPRAAWIARASAAGSPESRDESWTRAAQATLPESWIVRVYRGAQTFTVTIPKVQQPLALTVSPNPTATVPISDGLSVDAEIEWTLHFDAAVQAGMAVTIDLSKPDAPTPTAPTRPAPVPPVLEAARMSTPISTVGSSGNTAAPPITQPVTPPIIVPPIVAVDVVVIGVKNQTPADGAAQLHTLLDAQHYTRGLAFLAPGTPTSNTDDGKTTLPAKDPGDGHSFAVERGVPLSLPKDGSDGDRFAAALGIAPTGGEALGVVEHVDGANSSDDAHAQAMNGALWPATLGYFMQQLMAPVFDAATIDQARSYFLTHVRPGGPLPAFRVGRVPYGLLPVVALSSYAPDAPLPHALRILRDNHFLPAALNMPRVTAGSSDPDGDLLKALAVDASCQSVRLRVLLGEDVTKNTAGLFGALAQQALELQQAVRAATASSLLDSVGLGSVGARMGRVDPGAATDLIGTPLVTSAPLSETAGVDYISTLYTWANTRDLDAIQNDKLPGTERPLLYRVLRHALLLEMQRISVAPPAEMLARVAPTTGATATTAATATTTATVTTVTATLPVDLYEPELVNLATGSTSTGYAPIRAAIGSAIFGSQLAGYLGYLGTLAKLSSAELHRRFGETLDACSHRLEAWITSLAYARLLMMRAANPTGCYYGAFGWVENVRPATATSAAPIGGFIHAPSASHAATAAILRNGYLSRGGGGSPYAVALDSTRTRAALDVLDGTRQGEPLAALLGYRFERDLHAAQLDPYIADVRARYPLVAGRTSAGSGPVELVAASTVVDGLALWKAGYVPAALTGNDATNYQKALTALGQTVDGLADLLTAESVFQAVRGNPNAAAASLDALAQGTLPPDVDVVRTPSGGAALTQRLAVVLDGSTTPSADATPRAAAEPFLDAWVGTLLGDLAQVGCHVIASDGTAKSVTLDQLGLHPLDVVALAKTPPSGLGDCELDRRVLDAAAAAPGAAIDYAPTDVVHSFAEWLELARAAGGLLGGARALTAADLVAPADAASAPVTAATAQQAATRATNALTALAAAATALGTALAPVAAKLADTTQPAPTDAELTALKAALRSASLFGAACYPDPTAAAADLAALATTTATELAARQAAAPALTSSDAPTLLAAATQTMTAIFGRDFLFLPQLVPSAPADLTTALAEAKTLVSDANLPRRIVQQLARVRPAVGRWRALFLYAEALGTTTLALDVAQLPTGQAAWAAAKGAAPASGTVSLLLHRPTAPAPTASCAGFVVDEWNELIPAATQATALSFRHESPVAEAPQAVLLAVPPNASQTTWDQETLINTVREALMLAKVRLVDTIDDLRPFLPAICLTGNTANETISTNFLGSLIADPIIQRSA